jgi:N-acetyl sugar amidotransferase
MIRYNNKSDLTNSVDYVSRFKPGPGNHEAMYGLPEEVRFCSRCVISNQRPNSAVEYEHTRNSAKQTISFDQENICSACRVAENKELGVNWRERENQLHELCRRYSKKGSGYDCLVPGSGGKDSFFAAHILKYKFGMRPLTVTWAPHLYTTWGWNNWQAWINAGFDNYLMTPNPKVHRLITRLALENLFHPFQPFMIGQKAMAPKLAELFDIPLVFYGENESEYGNPAEEGKSAQRDWRYFSRESNSEVFLGGVSVDELGSDFGIERADLEPYTPIDPEILWNKGIEVHYLGYYLPWHPQGAYYYAVENGGFKASPERTPGTYSKYNSIDDKMDDFHYYTTYVKFGLGRASYDAAQEIRNGEITRDEGIALVKKFDGEFPDRFADEVFDYLSIPHAEYPVASDRFDEPVMQRSYFDSLADSFRSPHLWFQDLEGWRLRNEIWGDKISAK